MHINHEKTEREEELIEKLQNLLKKYGQKGFEKTRNIIFQEKIECEKVNEAIKYFMLECWHDYSRPGLLAIVCESVGGKPEDTTSIAASLSLISGGIDIHDDIIDQSRRKAGRLTLLGKFGYETALLVADALIFKGLTTLSQEQHEIPHGKIKQINMLIKDMFFELGTAEALELNFRRRLDVKPQEYIEVIKKKAADVEAHTRIGGILGNATKPQIEALGEYGRLLGMLLILRDDLIDVLEPEEAKHRIKIEHLPLPILYTLQEPKISNKLVSLLTKKRLTKNEIEQVSEIVDNYGGFKKTTEMMEALANRAEKTLLNIVEEREKLTLIVRATVPHYN